jgi:hypothetical protein
MQPYKRNITEVGLTPVFQPTQNNRVNSGNQMELSRSEHKPIPGYIGRSGKHSAHSIQISWRIPDSEGLLEAYSEREVHSLPTLLLNKEDQFVEYKVSAP